MEKEEIPETDSEDTIEYHESEDEIDLGSSDTEPEEEEEEEEESASKFKKKKSLSAKNDKPKKNAKRKSGKLSDYELIRDDLITILSMGTDEDYWNYMDQLLNSWGKTRKKRKKMENKVKKNFNKKK